MFWLLDPLVHKFLYREENFEWLPSDGNELWMRTAIIVLVILLGGYTDYHTDRLLEKEEEKHRVYGSTITVTHHILHNFLNKMQLFRLWAVSDISEDGIRATLFAK